MNEADRERLDKLDGHYATLNREMGVVQGQLTIIKWLMGGTFLGVLGNFILGVLDRV